MHPIYLSILTSISLRLLRVSDWPLLLLPPPYITTRLLLFHKNTQLYSLTHHPQLPTPSYPRRPTKTHHQLCSVRYDREYLAQNRLPLSRFPDALPATINSRADISRVGARIIDELVRAMRDIDLDDVELACVKALVFFDPSE